MSHNDLHTKINYIRGPLEQFHNEEKSGENL